MNELILTSGLFLFFVCGFLLILTAVVSSLSWRMWRKMRDKQ